MIVSSDVRSILPKVRASTLRDGARKSQTLLPQLLVDSDSASTLIFEEEVTRAFIKKLRSGIDVPNYPQFRDVNETFLKLVRGVEKNKFGNIARAARAEKGLF